MSQLIPYRKRSSATQDKYIRLLDNSIGFMNGKDIRPNQQARIVEKDHYNELLGRLVSARSALLKSRSHCNVIDAEYALTFIATYQMLKHLNERCDPFDRSSEPMAVEFLNSYSGIAKDCQNLILGSLYRKSPTFAVSDETQVMIVAISDAKTELWKDVSPFVKNNESEITIRFCGERLKRDAFGKAPQREWEGMTWLFHETHQREVRRLRCAKTSKSKKYN